MQAASVERHGPEWQCLADEPTLAEEKWKRRRKNCDPGSSRLTKRQWEHYEWRTRTEKSDCSFALVSSIH